MYTEQTAKTMWWPPYPTPEYEGGEPQCELLGPFALIVQGTMGMIAILSLVYKRNREIPRRPWWIWFFDVLKQVFGSAGLHMLNLLMSILFSESGSPELDTNPCTWYFLNVLVDTTLGVPILWFFLFVVHTTVYRFGVSEIVSGEYGEPPRWRAFFKQAILYLAAMVLMKIVLYAFFWWTPFIDDLGQFLISWTYFDPRVQVAFVMLVFPLVMNTIQYYLIDTIIQSEKYHNKNISDNDDDNDDNDDENSNYGTITPDSINTTSPQCRYSQSRGSTPPSERTLLLIPEEEQLKNGFISPSPSILVDQGK